MTFLPPLCVARLPLALLVVLAAFSVPGEARGGIERPGRAAGARPTERSDREAPALAARLELEVPGKPEGVLALDLERDGRDELLVLSKAPGVLSVFRELPSGWRLRGEARAIAVGDYSLGPVAVPRRGASPLAALASRAALELVWVDPLAATGEEIIERRTLRAAPRAIASGDLDRDGAWEVVIVDARGSLGVFRAGEEPAWIATERILASCVYVLSDGSGIVIGDQGERRLVFLEGTHADKLRLVAELPLDGVPRAIGELDVDGSGDLELLVAGGDRSLWSFGIGEEGPHWSGEQEPLERELGTIPLRLATADFTGDGAQDLALLFHAELSYRVLSGFGGEVTSFGEYAGQAPWGLAAGDFDGDGRPDLAIANREASRVSLIFGGKNGRLREAERLATGRAPHSIAAADLDGDGDRDLAVIHSLEATFGVLRREPGGWAREPSRPAGPGANHLRAITLAGAETPALSWTTTDASGARLRFAWPFERDIPLPEEVKVGSSSADLEYVDLDGDGAVEALAADADDGRLVRVRFGRSAEIAPRVDALELPAAPRALAPISVTGEMHIAVACAGEGKSGVALVRSRAGALEIAHYEPVPYLPIALAVGDLDGDGHGDLALLSRRAPGDATGLLQAWLQRGLTSWEARDQLQVGQRPYQVAAGDLDGNGRADVVVSAQNSHHVNLWLADSSDPVNLVRQADLGAGAGCLDVVVVDLDGDGALEIVVANAFSNDLSRMYRAR